MKYREAIVTSSRIPASQADAVFDAVRRADLRRRRRAALEDLLAATTVGLGLFAAVAVLRLLLPIPFAAWIATATLAALVLALAAVRIWQRPPDFPAAAATLDRAARLDDAVATATWFGEHPDGSPWVEAQRLRAADAASTLDIDTLVPVAPPRRLLRLSGALAALIVVALVVPASWTRGVFGLSGETRGVAVNGSDPSVTDAGDEHAGVPMTPEELLAAAEQGLRGPAGAVEPGESGDPGAGRGAAASGAADAGSATAPDVAAGGPPPSDAERGDLDESGRAAGSAETLEQALDRVAEDARQAAEAAAQAARAEEQSGAAETASGDESGGGGGADNQGGGATPSEADAAGGMAGGHQSGPGGEAADAAGLDALGAELEIALTREQLASPFAAQSGRSDEPLVERQSEGGAARLAYQDVAVTGAYQGSSASRVRPIPWAYRPLLRTYFLERASQDSRKDPE
jgi:hypothetical protein